MYLTEGKRLLQSQPRDSIFHHTVRRLPTANQVFLRSWTIDICQEVCSQRLASQRRYTDTVLAQSLWVGHAFCALPRSEQLRRTGAW